VTAKPLSCMWATQSLQQPQLGSFQTSTAKGPVAARASRGATVAAPIRPKATSRWRRGIGFDAAGKGLAAEGRGTETAEKIWDMNIP